MVSLDLGYGTIEVWIQSERTRLPEYETRSGPQAACWLPSVDGQVCAGQILSPVYILIDHIQAYTIHYATLAPLRATAMLLITIRKKIVAARVLRVSDAPGAWVITSIGDSDESNDDEKIAEP